MDRALICRSWSPAGPNRGARSRRLTNDGEKRRLPVAFERSAAPAQLIRGVTRTGGRAGRWSSMNRLDPSSLFQLSRRCMREWPSRLLDGRIYCAIRGEADANNLGTSRLIEARANGFVLIGQAAAWVWVASPRFTLELEEAKSLLPLGLVTISRDPMIACATALRALALTYERADRSPWPAGGISRHQRHGGD
jgi:hypothetical protein